MLSVVVFGIRKERITIFCNVCSQIPEIVSGGWSRGGYYFNSIPDTICEHTLFGVGGAAGETSLKLGSGGSRRGQRYLEGKPVDA